MTSGSDSTAPDALDPVGSPGPTPSSASRPTGLVLEPFRALRYTAPAEQLPQLTSPPYDVIDDAGVAALEAADPTNVVRLILPRDTPGTQDRYQRAAATLAAWRSSGVLALDD